MDCPFQVGDEVVCVDALGVVGMVHQDSVYVVRRVKEAFLYLEGVFAPSGSGKDGLFASRFRKVERKSDKRSLTEWLSQPSGDTDRLDKPVKQPAKVRERG